MKPTTDWMAKSFETFNNKYFNGELTLPNFSIRCNNEYWGYYMPDGTYKKLSRVFKPNGPGTIYLNGKWDREEKDWEGTLIHEMIHMYINEVLLKYPINAHGKEFNEIANRINQDGYNIQKTNEKKSTDVYNGNNGSNKSYNYQLPEKGFKACLLCFLNQPNDPNNTVWVFKAEPDKLQDYINTAKSLKPINGADSINVYYCYSTEINSMPSSPTTLDGIGANGFYDAIYLLKEKYNAILGKKNFRFFRTIQL